MANYSILEDLLEEELGQGSRMRRRQQRYKSHTSEDADQDTFDSAVEKDLVRLSMGGENGNY